jgi:bifunctional oligoribonuclease and PAP phosphatase NrnA
MRKMSGKMARWQRFFDFIHAKNHLLITTHVNPDGDAIGSETALADYLKQVGKQVTIINVDPTPAFFAFLDHEKNIQRYDAQHSLPQIEAVDGCIVVDVSEWKRLGDMSLPLQQKRIPLACIDHHPVVLPMSGVQVIDAAASSTGELVYDLLIAADAEFTPLMLDALYTCLLTDTGSFRFSNTTAKTHSIAADLLRRGARFRDIYSELFESYSKHRVWLQGELLANMRFEFDDRLAWFVLSQEIMRKTGAQLWEAEGFSELPNVIRGAEVSIMFTEAEDGSAKASFRSKGRIPIRPLAEAFGGGGHAFAAGAELQMNLEEAVKILIPAALNYIRPYLK